jgi:peptidoglycan/LPS O-acetylase OafA/YrhL
LITKRRIVHIDGLRGIAIFLVILYHFFPQLFRGGFVGVDVFFVISGYVIHRHLTTLDRFDFREFYTRRAIRIFPSLLIIVLVVTILSQFFLLDYPKRLLMNSVMASSVFLTNFYFFSTSNYFDLDSLAKPLLPLWSLAVEEQFYLLWPLLFWGLKRKFKSWLVLLIFISFVSALYLGSISQSYNFYSLQTRFWEIAVGIFLSALKIKSTPRVVVLLRVILISLSLVFVATGIGSETWPNFATLVIVFATAIAIASPGAKLERILSRSEVVFLGRISFPLYLIHWPLLSIYSSMNPAYIPLVDKIVLITLSVLLAFLLYQFVETPIQQIRGSARTLVALLVSCLLLASGGLAFLLKSELPGSSREIRQSIASSSSVVERNDWYFSGGSDLTDPKIDYRCNQETEIELVFACELGMDWASVNAVVVGDSKAEIVFRALLRQDGDLNWGFIGGALDPVIPLISEGDLKISQPSNSIPKFLADENQIQLIVVVAATRNLFDLSNDYSLDELAKVDDLTRVRQDFMRWLNPLATANKQIFLIKDNPTLRDPTFCHGVYSAFPILDKFVQLSENTEGCFYQLDQYRKDTLGYGNLLKELAAKTPSLRIIDSTDYYCVQSLNRCDLFKDGRLLYSYTDHISDYAADNIAMEVVLAARDSTL